MTEVKWNQRSWDPEMRRSAEQQDKSAPRGAQSPCHLMNLSRRDQASTVTKIKACHRSNCTMRFWWAPLWYWMDENRRWEQLINSIVKIRKRWQEMMTVGCEGQTSGLTSLGYFIILQTTGGVNMSYEGFWQHGDLYDYFFSLLFLLHMCTLKLITHSGCVPISPRFQVFRVRDK